MQNQLIESIQKYKGQFASVEWLSTEKSVAADHKAHVLTKRVSAVCRAGIDYANMAKVKDGIANGERGEVAPLPWGEWKAFPYVVTHKGEDYVRLYPSGQNRVHSTYYVDGAEVSKAQYAAMLQPAAARKLMEGGAAPDVLTIKASNLLRVG